MNINRDDIHSAWHLLVLAAGFLGVTIDPWFIDQHWHLCLVVYIGGTALLHSSWGQRAIAAIEKDAGWTPADIAVARGLIKSELAASSQPAPGAAPKSQAGFAQFRFLPWLMFAAAGLMAISLASCSGTPIDNTLGAASNVAIGANGTASVVTGTGQKATGLGSSLENALAAGLGPDLAEAYNIVANANPPYTLGTACFGDWIKLDAAMKSAPIPPLVDQNGKPIALGPIHIFTDVANLAVGLQKAGLTPLKTTTLTDCVAMINDMKSKALAIPGGLTTLMTALLTNLIADREFHSWYLDNYALVIEARWAIKG